MLHVIAVIDRDPRTITLYIYITLCSQDKTFSLKVTIALFTDTHAHLFDVNESLITLLVIDSWTIVVYCNTLNIGLRLI